MTTELEKKFFEAFDIKPETGVGLIEFKEPHYPPIKDRHYLELICVLNSVSVELKSECIEDLKQEILGEMKILLEYAPNEETEDFIKHQVQELFKGE